MVDRAGPLRAAQEPDRPGDRLRSGLLVGALSLPQHGELSIDNNFAERILRAQAIGRRNWTFLGSDRGGRTAAVLYSLTGTCKHHDIDPFAYLQDIRGRFPAQPGDRLGELLPDVWFEARPQARRKKVA